MNNQQSELHTAIAKLREQMAAAGEDVGIVDMLSDQHRSMTQRLTAIVEMTSSALATGQLAPYLAWPLLEPMAHSVADVAATAEMCSDAVVDWVVDMGPAAA